MNEMDIDIVVSKGYIGTRLKESRQRRNLSQKDISEMSGLCRATVGKIEHGGEYSFDSLAKYINCMGYALSIVKQKEE